MIIALPNSPAGEQLAWVLDQGRTASATDVAAHLSPTALNALPADKFVATLQQLGPLTVVAVDTEAATPTSLSAVVHTADGTALVAMITVGADAPNLITTLQFRPPPPSPPSSWTDVDAHLGALAPSVSLAAVELAGDGTPTAVHVVAPDQPHPLGSAFKLYVLGALTDAVTAGALRWDTALTIVPDIKSLPSGELQNQPDGSTISVEDAATKMISISDNTAADLLARAVGGQDSIAKVLAPMGMGVASQRRTLPFLTTKQLFILKWGVDPSVRDQYATADEAGRGALLTNLATTLPLASAVDPDVPVAIDQIEWFASANELVAAQAFLDARGDDPALRPLATVLGTNPGLPLDPATWPRVAYKGGSEPGVLSLSWLLHRRDGRRFAVALLAENTSGPVDDSDAVSIAAGVIGLLASA